MKTNLHSLSNIFMNSKFLVCIARRSAISAITYALLIFLISVLALVAIASTGTGINSVFGLIDQHISVPPTNQTMTLAQLGPPNPNLNSEQQSEIANAASEVANGTASLACLAYMNDAANATSMVNNSATCLGPGLNITPPAEPIKLFYRYSDLPYFTYPDGQIYAAGQGATHHESNLNGYGLWFYANGYVENGGYDWDTNCAVERYYPQALAETDGDGNMSCTGGTLDETYISYGGNSPTDVTNSSTTGAVLGYSPSSTW